MIKEVAIEPEVMATWQYFRMLWNDLGVSRGRLAAEFPPDWREVVCRRAYELSSSKAASIAARLKPPPGTGGARRWISSNRSFDKGKDWLTNAEKHGGQGGFSAIVARKNPRANNVVLVAEDFATDKPPWASITQREVARTAAMIRECAECLLLASQELVLVEPNFDATLNRFRDPFEALVGCRKNGHSWKRLELHVKFPTDKDGNLNPAAVPNQLATAQHYLSPLIPTGNTMQFFFWQRQTGGKRMHARFILTELGGLQPDYGLDEGDALGDTTIVSLMADEVWELVRRDYCGATKSFVGNQSWKISIVGQKP